MAFNNGLKSLNGGNYGVPNVLHPYIPNVYNPNAHRGTVNINTNMNGGFIGTEYFSNLTRNLTDNVKDFTQTTAERVGKMFSRIKSDAEEESRKLMNAPSTSQPQLQMQPLQQQPMYETTQPTLQSNVSSINQPLATQMVGGYRINRAKSRNAITRKGKNKRKTSKHSKKKNTRKNKKRTHKKSKK